MMDDDDVTSTATMTSVTGELSLDESDTTTTSNDIDTSSQITSSEINDEGNNTVTHGHTFHVPMTNELAACEIDGVKVVGAEEGISPTSEEQDTSCQVDNAESSRPDNKHRHCTEPTQDTSFPDLLSMPGLWYQHPCFDHYWQHYQYVSMWCQKHMELYRKMVQQYKVATAPQRTMAKQSGRGDKPLQKVFKKPTSGRTIRNRKARRRRKAAKIRMRMMSMKAEDSGATSVHSGDVSEDVTQSEVEGAAGKGLGEDEEEMQVEISDEMLEFFAHTHRHRRERDANKKNKAETEENHINIEEAKFDKKERTEAAPTERPGSKRTSEMRLLYGKGAAMIHGMETALQMNFDRNLDVKQPALWPNMPLRVIFD